MRDFVVSHSNSTSNHNSRHIHRPNRRVVSHSNSTSNHNGLCIHEIRSGVVSHSNSTSNHNIYSGWEHTTKLFLIPILHQTTTGYLLVRNLHRCFSFQFYIKPQLPGRRYPARPGCFSFQFYIKPQRRRPCAVFSPSCFSFQFYIKPQPRAWQ